MKRLLSGFCLVVILILSLILSSCGGINSQTTINTSPVVGSIPTSSVVVARINSSLSLENYSGGFFSIKKPAGWDVVTAGGCSTFAFYTRDKSNPANQIFFFGEVGPVYLADEQKEIDKDYMDMGGFPVQWFEMPVINPLTPENFLERFHLVAETTLAREFMPGMPDFRDIEIISVTEQETFINGGETKIIRALFRQGGQLGEGLFYITVAPVIPLTGLPSGGIGYGFCITGITAERDKFKYYEEKLQESLNSLTLSEEYVNECIKAQQQQGATLRNIADTLSETSDIIMGVWENRNRSDDIVSEKRSDAILGYERVYNPDTGTVYEVPLGFYDSYNINRNKYDMNNLQLLPDNDWALWTAPTEPETEIK